jgi:uncharacterized membrane protein YccC
LRTGLASVASLACARGLALPEAYWAPITTLIVMQSSLGDSWAISRRRLIGTVLGAALGACVLALGLGAGNPAGSPLAVAVFGGGVVLLGILCGALRLDPAAYRFAGVTLAVVSLVQHREAGVIVAVHRFIEVSLGIGVGLAISGLWPWPLPSGHPAPRR